MWHFKSSTRMKNHMSQKEIRSLADEIFSKPQKIRFLKKLIIPNFVIGITLFSLSCEDLVIKINFPHFIIENFGKHCGQFSFATPCSRMAASAVLITQSYANWNVPCLFTKKTLFSLRDSIDLDSVGFGKSKSLFQFSTIMHVRHSSAFYNDSSSRCVPH